MITVIIFSIEILQVVKPEEYKDCPKASFGKHPPDCICNYAEYDTATNKCINAECPELSRGTYPNCLCDENNSRYNAELNDCYIYCPAECTSYWPNCEC